MPTEALWLPASAGSSSIPYTTERRPDTGVSNVILGMWLFLASTVMLFGGLFSAYVLLRAGSLDWPAARTITGFSHGVVNTLLLAGASLMTAVASRAARGTNGSERWTRVLLLGTTILGAASLANTTLDYANKAAVGLYPAMSTFMAVFFLLTAVHAAHVLGGVIAVAQRAFAGRDSREHSGRAIRIQAVALYWHFLTAAWLCVFLMLYIA